jgi:hypothetical protein
MNKKIKQYLILLSIMLISCFGSQCVSGQNSVVTLNPSGVVLNPNSIINFSSQNAVKGTFQGNIIFSQSPMTNFVDANGIMWYSNTVTGAAKGLTTNLNSLETIISTTLPATNTLVNFAYDICDYKINTNVWFLGSSNVPSGVVRNHTIINLYNTNTGNTVTIYTTNFIVGVNSTNALVIPAGQTGRFFFDYDGFFVQTNMMNTLLP